jgi:hypothetical protein
MMARHLIPGQNDALKNGLTMGKTSALCSKNSKHSSKIDLEYFLIIAYKSNDFIQYFIWNSRFLLNSSQLYRLYSLYIEINLYIK